MKGYKFVLHKTYLDKGLGVTGYFKYLIAFFGLASKDVNQTLIIAILYALFCYILGWYWINHGYLDAENEVSNQFNPFVKEVREKI